MCLVAHWRTKKIIRKNKSKQRLFLFLNLLLILRRKFKNIIRITKKCVQSVQLIYLLIEGGGGAIRVKIEKAINKARVMVYTVHCTETGERLVGSEEGEKGKGS